MTGLLKLALIAVLLIAGYVLLQPKFVEWGVLNEAGTPSFRAKPLQEEVSEPAGPISRHHEITCPACLGEGKLTYIDRQARNHTYPCRICGFAGKRTLVLNPGAHICPDCKGMGRYAVHVRRRDSATGHVIDAHRCQRCAGSGQIQPQQGPGRPSPTPPIR